MSASKKALSSNHSARANPVTGCPLTAALAAIGDRLFWLTLRPVAACVGLVFALNGRWFGALASRPRIADVRIPASYVAPRWGAMEADVLARVPEDADLFLVGAGVGALPVCASLSRRFSIPAVDAGHALNMMNGMENKSAGPRLYTIHG